ncbi:tRNA-dihydrouridine synthase [Tersicoccus sp. MR15.9]|uniref:tRNA-dihydrouridine synthase n=1 Tax=Tersicoccus mangrovi TaxID=3121635 RepID=UPI002FE4FCB1
MIEDATARPEPGRRADEPATASTTASPARRRFRASTTVGLGVTAVLASALMTGCSPDGDVIDADYAQVCQDRTSQQRVEDDKCSDSGRAGGHYGWYFFPMGSRGSSNTRSLPGVGDRLSGGTTSVPAGASAKSGVPAKGSSSVSRGGFGGGGKGVHVGG